MATTNRKTADQTIETEPNHSETAPSIPDETTSLLDNMTSLHHRANSTVMDTNNSSNSEPKQSKPTSYYPYSRVTSSTPAAAMQAHEYAESVRQWLWQRQWAMQVSWYMYVTWPNFVMNCTAAANAAALFSPSVVLEPPGSVQQSSARARQGSPRPGQTPAGGATQQQQHAINPLLERGKGETTVLNRRANDAIDTLGSAFS